MIQLILKWLEKRKPFNRGFEFAKQKLDEDQLLALRSLKQTVEASKDFGDYSKFDMGIEAAIAEFKTNLNHQFGEFK